MSSILVIDNDPRMRLYLNLVLEGRGHSIREAPDPSTAVGLLHESPFDLLIADVLTRGHSGLDALRQLRCSHPELRLILTSTMAAVGSGELRKLASELGAATILAKPFRASELLQAVHDELRAARAAKRRSPRAA
jgi:DNA-binding response OmpR family regulator